MSQIPKLPVNKEIKYSFKKEMNKFVFNIKFIYEEPVDAFHEFNNLCLERGSLGQQMQGMLKALEEGNKALEEADTKKNLFGLHMKEIKKAVNEHYEKKKKEAKKNVEKSLVKSSVQVDPSKKTHGTKEALDIEKEELGGEE